MSPPETRRTSGDEKEPPTSQRLSLPSITEALGGEPQPISISSLLSTSGPQQKNSHVSQSPASPVARSYLESVPKSSADSLPHQTPASYRPQDTSERTNRPMYHSPVTASKGDGRFPSLSTFPSINSYDPYNHTQSSRTISSPSSYSRPGVSPLQRDKPSPPIVDKTSRTPGVPSGIPFGYSVNSYQSASCIPPPIPGVPSYRTPTLQQAPHWRSYGHHDERIEEIRRAISKESTPPKQTYGESVKRHLDIYDLESSLNEVSQWEIKTMKG